MAVPKSKGESQPISTELLLVATPKATAEVPGTPCVVTGSVGVE